MKGIAVNLILLVALVNGYAQQAAFTYQAVAVDQTQTSAFGKNSEGKLLSNQRINVRFSLRESSASGTVQYQETHETQTDQFGIFRLIVGRGSANIGSGISTLSWGKIPYFLEVEIDAGKGFQSLGAEEIHGAPFAISANTPGLSLQNNQLSIAGGNSITLADNDPQNELNQDVELVGTELRVTDAGGTKAVDLSTLKSLPQDLSLSSHQLKITNNTTATNIDLSPYLDDTQPTEAEVDAFVANNGYLTQEVDGSVSNEIQDLQLSNNTLTITNNAAATAIDLAPYVNVFSRNGTTVSNATNYEQDDFVVGSSSTEDIPAVPLDNNRMFFDKSKAAFRVGSFTGNQADDSQRGIISMAFGQDNTASNILSMAFGMLNTASGQNSLAAGYDNNVSGFNAISFGHSNVAPGDHSFSAGYGVSTISYGEVALGLFPTDNDPQQNLSSYDPDDRLFVIGNGYDDGILRIRRNALLMLKNGNTTLNGRLTLDADNVSGAGEPYSLPLQDGNAGQIITTDGNGNATWTNPPAQVFAIANNTVSNGASASVANDNFVFGSSSMEAQAGLADDSRMIFSKGKAAFRAGFYDGPQTNDVNVGMYSAAFGANNMALGTASFAAGTNNAVANNSAAFGSSSFALGLNSFVAGGALNITSGANYSAAFGSLNIVSGGRAFAAGEYQTVNGSHTAAFGFEHTLDGNYSFAAGEVNQVGGSHSAVFGHENEISGTYSFAAGESHEVDGNHSAAFGFNNDVLGSDSFAAGEYNDVTGPSSAAMGLLNIASGQSSFAAGVWGRARSLGEACFGVYATDYVPVSANGFAFADRIFVVGNGTGAGAESNAFVIYKTGNATLSGILTENSDKRLKKNIRLLNGSLDKILSLEGVNYQWNNVKPHDTVSLQTGFIAQQVKEVLPELVHEDSEGYYSVNYDGVIPHLVEAIKALKHENDALREGLSEERKRQDQLLERFTTLERKLAALETTASADNQQ